MPRKPSRATGGQDHPPRGAGAERRPPLGWPATPTVLVGLHAPTEQQVQDFIARAKQLRAAGATTVAIAEPPAPMARINPVGGGVLLSERVGIDVVLVIEASGRNLPALQADLLGAHALGLHTVLCRTGSLRAFGDYPDPGSPLEIDSVRLVATLAGLNDGVDWRGVAMPERTRFVIGAAVRTAPADLAREVGHVTEKVRAGAHFLVTDVIYDEEQAQLTLAAVRSGGIDLPIIGTIAPFEDAATLRQLRNEFPGSSVPMSAVEAARRAAANPAHAVDNAMATAERLAGLLAGILVSAPARPDARLAELVGKLAARERAR